MSKLHRIAGLGAAEGDNSADVVFVHGLGGDPFATWCHGEADSESWPSWLAREFPEVAVWSLGYAASPTKWSRITRMFGRGDRNSGQSMSLPDRATQVLDTIVLEGLGQRPLVFVCHSLGGLLVKQALRKAVDSQTPSKHLVAGQVRGVMFLATPHNGAVLANLISAFRSLLGATVSIDDLREHDAHLRDLYDWYRNHAPRLQLRTVSYYEGRDVRGVARIVNPSSSHPGVGADPIQLDEDHLSIAKPRNTGDQVCKALRQLLREVVVASDVSVPSAASLAGWSAPASLPAAWAWPRPRDFSTLVTRLNEGFTGRVWLRERVLAWLRTDARGTRQTLLVIAPYGVGKSAFMAHLVGQLRKQGFATVLHFCRFDEQDDLQPGRIVRSIAAQLGELLPAYAAEVEASAEARNALDDAEAAASLAWSRAVVDPLCKIERAPGQPPLVLIVDGLDESLELHDAMSSPEGSLLDMIVRGTSSRLPRWVRIVASSRPVQKLGAQIDRFQQELMLCDDGAANRADLEAFVRERATEPTLQALRAAATLTEQEFVDEILSLCDGKFLIANYLVSEAASPHFGATHLKRVLRRSRVIPGIDAWFELVFARRMQHVQVPRAKARAVLGIVAVALTPLPAPAIAEVLHDEDVSDQDVHALVSAFGGLLRHDSLGGVTFDHFSIEQWLDPSRPEGRNATGEPKAGDFAIDRCRAHKLLQQHCSRCVERSFGHLKDRSFDRYLEKSGVLHLLDAGLLPQALALLARIPLTGAGMPARGPRPPAPPPPRRLETRVIGAIGAALREFDRCPPDDATPAEFAELRTAKARACRALATLDAEALHHLLRHRDYETGKYQPLLRVLIQFLPATWLPIRERCLADVRDDIVFRSDLGIAYAEAWWSSEGDDRDRVLQAIEQMAEAANVDEREIAGYALKRICQKIEPRPWWADIEPFIRRLAARFATSDDFTDRMVAGEMLLALAVQNVAVLDWFSGLPGEQRFWQPCWGNLRMDVEAICVLADRAPIWSHKPPKDAAVSLAAAAAQHKRTLELASKFAIHSLFKETATKPNLWRLHWAVGLLQDQQCDTDGLGESLDDLLTLLSDPPDGFNLLLLDIVSRLMLHPAWDITETGASLVANLIKRKGRATGPWWLIDRLLEAPPEQWRLLYGAVDAAFNAGPLDSYAKFREALVAVGKVPQCRVRGICADNLRMWLKRASPSERRAWLNDPPLRNLLRCWLETADDIWLLEYLYLIFNEMAQPNSGVADLISGLVPDNLSQCLQVSATQPFYAMEMDEYLKAVSTDGNATRA